MTPLGCALAIAVAGRRARDLVAGDAAGQKLPDRLQARRSDTSSKSCEATSASSGRGNTATAKGLVV
jgi:hypothetical protein